MGLASVTTIAVLAGGAVGMRVRVRGWVPALILAAGLAAFALGFVLGYEDDTRGGGSGFETGVLIASALILVAIAAMSGFMVGAIRRR
jgi:hypothetical protein